MPSDIFQKNELFACFKSFGASQTNASFLSGSIRQIFCLCIFLINTIARRTDGVDRTASDLHFLPLYYSRSSPAVIKCSAWGGLQLAADTFSPPLQPLWDTHSLISDDKRWVQIRQPEITHCAACRVTLRWTLCISARSCKWSGCLGWKNQIQPRAALPGRLFAIHFA